MELDAYKAECDALKRKCKELRQDLEHVMMHACKGPFGMGPKMPDDELDELVHGHKDKKAKSNAELKNFNNEHTIMNPFAGQEDHHGNMLPESPPESPSTTLITTTMLLLPDPAVPDQEQDPSDELVVVEPHDLGQLDLGDMWLWSILQAC